MKIKSNFVFTCGKLKIFFSAILLSAFLLIGSGYSEAAIVDFTDAKLDALVKSSDEIFDTLDSDILHYDYINDVYVSVGNLKTAVYRTGTNYIYVLEVTPSVDGTDEINMGHNLNTPIISNNYGDFGYSYSQASDAFSITDATGIFDIYISEKDNTLDWELISDDYTWASNKTITLFYEHSSAPVTNGFYNFIAPSSNGEGIGYVPAPVPIPGSFLLLGSSVLGLIGLRRKKRV